jgi:hypothetical protein
MDKTIEDILIFYAKTHYKKYLEDTKISKINDNEIYGVVSTFYDGQKSNISVFVINTYKKLCEQNNSEYPGDFPIKNILLTIFQKDEDEYIKNKITHYITTYQNKE